MIRSDTSRRTGLPGSLVGAPGARAAGGPALLPDDLAPEQEAEPLEQVDDVAGQRPVGLAAQVGDVDGDAPAGLELVEALAEHVVEHVRGRRA